MLSKYDEIVNLVNRYYLLLLLLVISFIFIFKVSILMPFLLIIYSLRNYLIYEIIKLKPNSIIKFVLLSFFVYFTQLIKLQAGFLISFVIIFIQIYVITKYTKTETFYDRVRQIQIDEIKELGL